MSYDVFVSCKSEDYQLGQEVYDFLTESGLSVFMADAELRKRGKSEYGKVINEALESSEHFILLASKAEYASSPYVEEEWQIFLEEKRSGRKHGNILTILKDIDVATLPIPLRRHQSFKFSEYNGTLDYLWPKRRSSREESHTLIEGVEIIKVEPEPNTLVDGIEIIKVEPEPEPKPKPEPKPASEQKPEPKSSKKDAVVKFTVNGVSFEMVRVDGGTFAMGNQRRDEDGTRAKAAHQVSLANYYIGKFVVTQALWKAVMDGAWAKLLGINANPSQFKGNNRPVENVSWVDCQKFIKRLNKLTGKNFRLPSEAEWEYAARGGQKGLDYEYAGSNNIDKVAWHADNSSGKTHAVGLKKSNELGLYDMSGNVDEWCQDYRSKYKLSSLANPAEQEANSFRVIRGGNFSRYSDYCLVTHRNFARAKTRSMIGLRLCLSE